MNRPEEQNIVRFPRSPTKMAAFSRATDERRCPAGAVARRIPGGLGRSRAPWTQRFTGFALILFDQNDRCMAWRGSTTSVHHGQTCEEIESPTTREMKGVPGIARPHGSPLQTRPAREAGAIHDPFAAVTAVLIRSATHSLRLVPARSAAHSRRWQTGRNRRAEPRGESSTAERNRRGASGRLMEARGAKGRGKVVETRGESAAAKGLAVRPAVDESFFPSRGKNRQRDGTVPAAWSIRQMRP